MNIAGTTLQRLATEEQINRNHARLVRIGDRGRTQEMFPDVDLTLRSQVLRFSGAEAKIEDEPQLGFGF